MPDDTESPVKGRCSEPARMSFPRRVDSLSRVFDFSSDFYAASRIGGELTSTADFVLEELFTNQVKYNPGGASEIEVCMFMAEDALEITVTDLDSDRFDLREAGEVDVGAPLADRKPGGLGIHLVRKFAKRIDYDYVDRRSRVTIYLDLG